MHKRSSSMDKNKRLYRSKNNSVFAGICGGLGEYLDIDPVVVRLVWLLVVVFTGFVPGVLAYIIAIFIIPKENFVNAMVVNKETTV
jgi:phage shock protein C